MRFTASWTQRLLAPLATGGLMFAAAAPAFAAPSHRIGDRAVRVGAVAADPRADDALLVSIAPVRDDLGAPAAIRARVVGADDRATRDVTLGTDARFDGRFDPSAVSVAVDTVRDRYLVAWPAHGPDLTSGPCAPTAPPPAALPPSSRPCSVDDVEIHVRLVDRRGRPVGRVQRVTATGDDAQPELASHAPSVAYDPRGGGFLLAYTAAGNSFAGVVGTQRLDAAGAPVGAPQAVSQAPGVSAAGQLVAGSDGGFLLAEETGPDSPRVCSTSAAWTARAPSPAPPGASAPPPAART